MFMKETKKMNISLIYADNNIIVKRVDYMNKFLYTVTYILDDEGRCIKEIKVCKDGKILEQQFE